MFTCDNEYFDTLEEAQQHCYNQEIIYYCVAIDYLKEHDPSLRESLGYASDCGYKLESLSSEDLATLLCQQKLLDEIEEVTESSEDPSNAA